MFQLGYYLNVPVLVVEDLKDGWVWAIFPDNENPNKRKPFTYKKNDRWKLWKDQVKIRFDVSNIQ